MLTTFILLTKCYSVLSIEIKYVLIVYWYTGTAML